MTAENAYQDEQIFKWFSQFTRNQHPDRVRYVSSDYDHTHAYWATLDRLTPGTFATLDAQFTGPNRIEVKTSELGAFTLNLAGHPKFARGQAVSVTIDGKAVSASASDFALIPQGRKPAGLRANTKRARRASAAAPRDRSWKRWQAA